MIHELKPEGFHKVRDYFQEIGVINAQWVIGRNVEGRVFVDNLQDPKTAIVKHNETLFLGGDCNNRLFIEEVYKLSKTEDSKFTFMDAWYIGNNKSHDVLKEILIDPVIYRSLSYEMTELKFDWRSNIPEGIKVVEINQELLESDYENIYLINDYIKYDFNGSMNKFLAKSGGFCLVKDKTIISMAPLYYNDYSNTYSLGIFTVEEFRKKGYASLVAAASSEYCLAKGSKMKWTHSHYNKASENLAIKLGHKHTVTSKVYYTYFDRFISCEEHLLSKIYSEKKFEEALELLEKMYKVRIDNDKYLWIGEKKFGGNKYSYCKYFWTLHNIYLLDEDNEKALENLNKAIELGKNDPEQLEYVINKCDDPMEHMLKKREELIKEMSKEK